jgi:transcriptional regulator with XRE-family HTH domain
MNEKAPYWGSNLQELMNWRDMSVDELAELAGVTRAAVYQWLSKPYPTLSAEKAATLQKIFQVPYHKIFPLMEDDAEKDQAALALTR